MATLPPTSLLPDPASNGRASNVVSPEPRNLMWLSFFVIGLLELHNSGHAGNRKEEGGKKATPTYIAEDAHQTLLTFH